MRARIDHKGRIKLNDELREQMNLHPGDEVVFENRDGTWVLSTERSPSALEWKGDVLVHQGSTSKPVDETLQELREERLQKLSEGLLP